MSRGEKKKTASQALDEDVRQVKKRHKQTWDHQETTDHATLKGSQEEAMQYNIFLTGAAETTRKTLPLPKQIQE